MKIPQSSLEPFGFVGMPTPSLTRPWDNKVIIPLIRRVVPNMIAHEIISAEDPSHYFDVSAAVRDALEELDYEPGKLSRRFALKKYLNWPEEL